MRKTPKNEIIVGDKFDAAVWPLEAISYRINRANVLNPIEVSGHYYGTGFLFERTVGPYHRQFLVSNKHFLVEDNPFCLMLRLSPDQKFPKGSTYRLFPTESQYSTKDPLYSIVHAHWDPDIDLAVVDVTDKIRELKAQLQYRNFQVKPLNVRMVPYGSDWNIARETPCAYLGYPDKSNNPRVKTGRLGQNPSKVQTSYIPLDEVRVAQGASGSPAFVKVDFRTKLLGIVFGTAPTEMVPGHIEFDQGFAVKVTALMELTDYVLRQQGLLK